MAVSEKPSRVRIPGLNLCSRGPLRGGEQEKPLRHNVFIVQRILGHCLARRKLIYGYLTGSITVIFKIIDTSQPSASSVYCFLSHIPFRVIKDFHQAL